MWILPADLSGLHVELDGGPHLLPWHYTESEVDRLAWLLRPLLQGVGGEIRLDDATLRVLSDRRVTTPKSLVVVVLQKASPELDEVSERVRALGARCALLQFPEPQEMGYGWLERQVKAPLYRAISAWVTRPEHPLAAFNAKGLPVMDAAALTTDPVELIDVLERTLMHRLHHADVGCEDDDYHRSLLLSAGKRLAERLQRLSVEPLAAALELVLGEGKSLEDRARHRLAMAAIESVGLGRRSGGELSLGPLARSATSTLALGALESDLLKAAWSETARARLGALLAAQVTGEPTAALGVRGESTSTLVNVPPPADLLEKPIVLAFSSHQEADSVVRLLREIGAVPSYRSELPAALQERLVGALRWLDEVRRAPNRFQQRVGQMLEGLLRLWSARGPDALRQEEQSLKLLRDVVEQEPEPWIERAGAASDLRHAVLCVGHRRSREDLDHAEELVRRQREVTRRLDGEDAALDVAAYLCLAEIALSREDLDRAHDCADKALHVARVREDAAGQAASLLSVARASTGQKRYVEAEQRAREALALFEATGDVERISASLRVIAQIILQRHGPLGYLSNKVDRLEAVALSEQSLATAEAIGDVEGHIESLVLRIGAGVGEGHDDRLRELAFQAVSLAETAASPALQAEAYSAVALSFLVRRDSDEAIKWVRRALAIYEDLGAQTSVNNLRGFLAEATKP